jgi:hypothetical protein
VPSKSKPALPSRASMRLLKVPPSRRSTRLVGECQSGEAKFQRMMSSGVW